MISPFIFDFTSFTPIRFHELIIITPPSSDYQNSFDDISPPSLIFPTLLMPHIIFTAAIDAIFSLLMLIRRFTFSPLPP